MTSMRSALTVDLSLCTGCRACSLACVLAREQVIGLGKALICVDKHFPVVEAPVFVPVFCHMCEDAPCIDTCASGALYREEDTGMVVLDQGMCTGCGLCVDACPYDAIWMDEEKGTALKCDWCKGDPVCLRYCATRALKFA